jgi:DNA-binding NarL/FixJ family response regulator
VPTVAIVEDHLLLAETLRAALEQDGVTARVVAPAAPDALVPALLAVGADLVLLDLDLAGHGDSTPAIAPVVAAGGRVLLVTGTTDRLRIAAALEQGALGYQLKTGGFAALVDTARRALVATRPLDAEDRVGLLDELHRHRAARARDLLPFERLTAREADTLRALARGRAVTEIAGDWVVSEATVRSHVRGVLAKLEVGSQLAAVAAARRVSWQ